MCEWDNGGVVVDLPENMLHLKDSGRTQICIDECIVPQIKALWAAGISTLGCCCGHNKRECEVILPGHFDPTDVSKAYNILKEADPERRWHIKQWLLIDVAQLGERGNRG